jgi:DNA-binding MarR family transcriptional regulator
MTDLEERVASRVMRYGPEARGISVKEITAELKAARADVKLALDKLEAAGTVKASQVRGIMRYTRGRVIEP